MVSEPSGEGEGPSPGAIDRIVGRLGAHRSLPAVREAGPRALGPPSPVADESRLTREPISEVVVDSSSIYVTLELRLEILQLRQQLLVLAAQLREFVPWGGLGRFRKGGVVRLVLVLQRGRLLVHLRYLA